MATLMRKNRFITTNAVSNEANIRDQRLAALDDPHRPILSRVRCIALFGAGSRNGHPCNREHPCRVEARELKT